MQGSSETVPVAPGLARLERASGWLRTEVASAVTCKQAPLLTFQIAHPVGPLP